MYVYICVSTNWGYNWAGLRYSITKNDHHTIVIYIKIKTSVCRSRKTIGVDLFRAKKPDHVD